MKKTILALMAIVLNVLIGYSQNYNASQKSFIRSLQDFLKSEGYNPERQDDGLKFTRSGDVYYLEVSNSDCDPMYLRLRRYIRYNAEISKEYVSEQLNTYNAKYGVKVLCTEKAVVLSAEMYLNEASEFTGIFDTLIMQLISAGFYFSE